MGHGHTLPTVSILNLYFLDASREFHGRSVASFSWMQRRMIFDSRLSIGGSSDRTRMPCSLKLGSAREDFVVEEALPRPETTRNGTLWSRLPAGKSSIGLVGEGLERHWCSLIRTDQEMSYQSTIGSMWVSSRLRSLFYGYVISSRDS